MILPFHAAAPRLSTPQQILMFQAPATFGSYSHSCLPVLASTAITLLQGSVRYSAPSIIRGVVSMFWLVGRSTNQASPRLPTFFSLILSSGLKYCSFKVRLWVIHWPASASALSRRFMSTFAADWAFALTP